MLLRLADPDERYASVRLCSDLPLPDADYEHERFLGHFRGLIGQWIRERGATATLSAG
jgi:hypothetical protein